MNDELENKLIEKYPYMFAEHFASKEKEKQHNELTARLWKKDMTKDGRNVMKKEREKIGSFWPIAYGIECCDGWYELLDELMEKIQEADKDKTVVIHQIKEKLGGLRFYYDGGGMRLDIAGCPSLKINDNHINVDDIINEYEAKSYVTCEICGKPAKLCSSSGWLKTVCKDHRTFSAWPGEIKNPPYTPCASFYKEQLVIVQNERIAKIEELRFDEGSDEWIYTLDNDSGFSKQDLKHIPHNALYEKWFVIYEDLPDEEFVIVSKKFDIKEGWFYDIKNQKTNDVFPNCPEQALKAIKDEDGYIKSLD
jgi:hypothetical protein